MNFSFISPFARENLVSRDGFGRPVPSRFSPLILHIQKAEYSAHSQDSSRFPLRPEYIGPRNGVPAAFIAESPEAQG